MRELTSHKVNPANDTLTVKAIDGPGPGGASHAYEITGSFGTCILRFQNGPISEAGVNGITHEALLSILEDRLEGFQANKFACEENARALAAVREAQHWLQYRTLKRMARQVEGTHTV